MCARRGEGGTLPTRTAAAWVSSVTYVPRVGAGGRGFGGKGGGEGVLRGSPFACLSRWATGRVFPEGRCAVFFFLWKRLVMAKWARFLCLARWTVDFCIREAAAVAITDGQFSGFFSFEGYAHERVYLSVLPLWATGLSDGLQVT